MKTPEFIISERYLFPMIETMLEEGRKVRFTVSGNSMWPFIISNRDSVLLIPCEKTSLKKGDIILFQTGCGHYILHRITKVLKSGYITTGDGNLQRDGLVPWENVRAKVSVIYRKERVIECDRWYWKIIFRIWMLTFPIRQLRGRV